MFRDRGGSNRIPDRPRPRATLIENKNLYQSSGEHGLLTDHQFSSDEGVDVVVIHLLLKFCCHLFFITVIFM